MQQQLWELVTSERSVEVEATFGSVRSYVFGTLKKEFGQYIVRGANCASIRFSSENVRSLNFRKEHAIISIWQTTRKG